VALLNTKTPFDITCSLGIGIILGAVFAFFSLKHAVSSAIKVMYNIICVIRLKVLIFRLIDYRYLANLDKILYLYN
jgi:hypothetical protein